MSDKISPLLFTVRGLFFYKQLLFNISMTNIIEQAIAMHLIKNADEVEDNPRQLNVLEREIISRNQAVKVFQQLNNSLVLHQAPLTHPYDLWCKSGDTVVAIETKDRTCKSDEYEDSAVQYEKYQSLKELVKEGRQILFVSTYSDGVAYIYDVADCSENKDSWKHLKITSIPEGPHNPMVTDECQKFMNNEAIYRVRYKRS